jgi:tRNA (mo5U34)-methyltransferase
MSLQSTGGGGDGGALAEEIAGLAPWFHNLRLPNGATTAPDHPLGDFPSYKWEQIAPALPEDLRGCRALDIGCNAGFYTFELAKRGADVVAMDHDDHYLTQARWAADQLGLTRHVEFRLMDVYDLAGVDETFDIVIFMGVLYHLRYPLLGLDLVAEKVGGTLVFQTLTMPGDDPHEAPPDLPFEERERLRDPAWPAMAFVEHQLAGDPTNWWVPSASAVEAMVRTTGLRIVDRPGHEIWVCERTRRTHHREELDRATGRRSRG